MYAILVLAIILIYIAFFSNKDLLSNSYLGRGLIVLGIILLTSCNVWLGLLAVLVTIFLSRRTESFININNLFNAQNHLQKKVYYVPKRSEAPVPQNDTDYVPLNPMQSKAGAVQPSQPARISVFEPKQGLKTRHGNNGSNLLRIEEMVRPKSSKTMNYQTGLNKDYDPISNWPDGHAFKNLYAAAEN
jgi:hypothetical protein